MLKGPGLGRRTFAGSLAAMGLVSPVVIGAPRIARADTTVLGAILPLSGVTSVFGLQARAGLDLAVDEINRAGGILGRQIEIDYRDDRGDPQVAADAAETLVGRANVVGVSGPISSASRDAMADIMIRSRTPLLYATDYEGGVCDECLFFFNSVPNQSAEPLMRYAVDQLGSRFFMLGADYVWPHEMFNVAAETIEARGGQDVGRHFIPLSGLVDYGAIINDIRDSDAQVLVLALPGAEHVAFLDQAEQAGLLSQVKVCGLGGLATYFEPGQTGPRTRAFGCAPFVETDPSPGVQRFVAGVRGLAGEDTVVSAYAMTHYNAVHALKAGLEASGEVSRESAVAGMSGLEYQIPTGTSRINADSHHSTLSMFIGQTRDGTLDVIEALGEIAPDPRCTI